VAASAFVESLCAATGGACDGQALFDAALELVRIQNGLDALIGPDLPECVAIDCPACSVIGEAVEGCPAHRVEGGPVAKEGKPPLAAAFIDAKNYRRRRAAGGTANSVCSRGHLHRFAGAANDAVREAQAARRTEPADLVLPVLSCLDCNHFACANKKGKKSELYDTLCCGAVCCRHEMARKGGGRGKGLLLPSLHHGFCLTSFILPSLSCAAPEGHRHPQPRERDVPHAPRRRGLLTRVPRSALRVL
jgi:hypothetical protein